MIYLIGKIVNTIILIQAVVTPCTIAGNKNKIYG